MVRHCPDELLVSHLNRWDIGARATIRRIRAASTADVWLVAKGDDRWIAKLTYDTPDRVEWGLSAAAILAGAGIGACTARSTRDGELIDLVAWPPGHLHPLAILDYIPGREWRWRASESGRRRAGSLLANMHQAWSAARFSPPQRLLAYLTDTRSDMLEAERVRSAVDRALALVDGSESAIYGDGLQCRGKNAGLSVVDWGTVGTAWRLFDIAIQLEAEGDLGDASTNAFVNGYLLVDPSMAAELPFLDHHRALAAAWRASYHAWAALNHSSQRHALETERSLRNAELMLASLDE